MALEIGTSGPTIGRTKTCWKCGTAFVCGPHSGNARCWCDELPPVTPRLDGSDCLCRLCLIAETPSPIPAIEDTSRSPKAIPRAALREGEDYYLDGSSFVFMAAYHRRRGTCCKNGCRHCPYK